MRWWANRSAAFGGEWFFHDDMPRPEREVWAQLKCITKNVPVVDDAAVAVDEDERGVPVHPIEDFGFREWLAWPLLKVLDKLIDWCYAAPKDEASE